MGAFSLFDLLLIAMGAYVLFAGITGKGKLYSVNNLKEGMEVPFKKTMRVLFIVIGISMLCNSLSAVCKNLLYDYSIVSGSTEANDAVYDFVLKEGMEQWSWATPKLFDILVYVFMGLSIVTIVLMVVAIRKMTDKNAPAQATQQANAQAARQVGHTLPVDAFDFDNKGNIIDSEEKNSDPQQ